MEHIGKQSAILDQEARISTVESIFVNIERQQHLLSDIQDCYDSHSRIIKRNLMITGPTNSGKSTVCVKYTDKYPRQKCERNDVVPIVYVKTPGVATAKQLAQKILASIGDPASQKGSLGELNIRILELLKKCLTHLLILDEFQHFNPVMGNKTKEFRYKEVLDWLKVLLEDAQLPVILVGLPSSEDALSQNEQLDRRFGRRFRLSPYSWDNENDRKSFCSILTKLDHLLPFEKLSNLSVGDMPDRFYLATGGVIGYLFDTIRPAAEAAIKDGLENISKNHLQYAYNEYILNFRKTGKGVFIKPMVNINAEKFLRG
jgi:hypothetical protein